MPGTHPARRPPGELEASVLAALWAADGPLTPADVQRDLGRALARTTVTTILARLHDKGAVARTRSGRGYAYTPTQDSPGLAARRMRTELDKEEDRETVLARFVSQLSTDDEQLLRALLDDADPGAEDAGVDEPGAGPGADGPGLGSGVPARGGERGPGGPR